MEPNYNIPTTFRPSNTIGNKANEHLTTVLPPIESVELFTVAKQTKKLQDLKVLENNTENLFESLYKVLNIFCNVLEKEDLEEGKEKVNTINPSYFEGHTRKIIQDSRNVSRLYSKTVYYKRLKKEIGILDHKIENINYPDNTEFQKLKDSLVESIKKMSTVLDSVLKCF
jgi:hypothetical protein